MLLRLPPDEEEELNAKSFSKMNKLRLLKICKVHLSCLNYLSNELCLLEWHDYLLESLPKSIHSRCGKCDKCQNIWHIYHTKHQKRPFIKCVKCAKLLQHATVPSQFWHGTDRSCIIYIIILFSFFSLLFTYISLSLRLPISIFFLICLL